MRRYKKGFTLVELMISVAILGVIVAITYDVINSSNTFFSKQNSNIKNNEDIRVVNTWLSRDLQSSSSFIDNSLSDDAKKGKAPIYEIGDIKYYKINTGKINDDNLYRIERHSNKDGKMVLIENVSEEGFIIYLNESNKFYEVTVALKDKFNTDKKNKFIVSTIKDVVITKPEIPDPEIPGEGTESEIFIDTNGDRRFNGDDYKVASPYDSNEDKKYTNTSWELVIGKDLSRTYGKDIRFIVEGGIFVKKGVTLTTNKSILLQTKSEINCNGVTLDCYGNGGIFLKANGSISAQQSKIQIDGGGEISIDGKGALAIKEANISISGGGNIDFTAGGALDCSKSNFDVSGGGNSKNNKGEIKLSGNPWLINEGIINGIKVSRSSFSSPYIIDKNSP
ncbi:prepilin-type N-terminal cleavage/methylation domain-containing protein [Clostridium sp. A1-XYC3]|uniref:Prepilin-type N-terminal cleavage/methylation domain-containing protein n=1 Tax=Clostridium tanneri TaxID=3037988 RepID=A0ABU4JX55_9CLOT|nr:prepilin-type N-terminal cleavage/methylation domain-containing protein [Clostridium sp. A1-XYC3]MDW8802738.1 prepilin-type N-terminal cleavage/methylation domain-containing protein [Clostridium sp. A1-XYC3]